MQRPGHAFVQNAALLFQRHAGGHDGRFRRGRGGRRGGGRRGSGGGFRRGGFTGGSALRGRPLGGGAAAGQPGTQHTGKDDRRSGQLVGMNRFRVFHSCILLCGSVGCSPLCWFQCTAKGEILQEKRDETTANRDEMQVRRVYLPLRGREPGNYPKRRPVVNARGVEDAAPYNYGAWGLLPNYTPISTHSNNFVRKIQRFVRSRLQGAAGYCTIIRVSVQNVPDKMTKKRPL